MVQESEHQIQSSILNYLGHRQIFHYRQNSGAVKTEGRFFQFGAVGSPDIVCIYKGKYIGIEVKAKKGRQSSHQKQFQEAMEDAGGHYILAKSIDDVMSYFEAKIVGEMI